MMTIQEFVSKLSKNHFMRYGLPFMVFTVGGSFVLKEFATVRYDISRHNKQLGVTPELAKQMGFEVKKKTLEEEYEEHVKTVDTDNWKNIRGPRPWEEPSKEYLDMIEKRVSEQQTKRKR